MASFPGSHREPALARAHCVKSDVRRALYLFVIASFLAENRFPLFGTML